MLRVLFMFLFSFNAAHAAREIPIREKLEKDLLRDQGEVELVQVVQGKRQNRKYHVTSSQSSVEVTVYANGIVPNIRSSCSLSSSKRWSEAKQNRVKEKVLKDCQRILETEYPSLSANGDIFCRPGILFVSNSKHPHLEERPVVPGSRERNRECYVDGVVQDGGDFEVYYSAILKKK